MPKKAAHTFFTSTAKLGLLVMLISLAFVPRTAFWFGITMHTWGFGVGVILCVLGSVLGVTHYIARRRAVQARA